MQSCDSGSKCEASVKETEAASAQQDSLHHVVTAAKLARPRADLQSLGELRKSLVSIRPAHKASLDKKFKTIPPSSAHGSGEVGGQTIVNLSRVPIIVP